MLPPTQRLNYFDHQFLRVNDFTDEQAYHLGMRRAHNRMLHTVGVAYGLDLLAAGSAVKVTAGVAIDGQGRELVLAADLDVPVPAELAGKTGYLTVTYGEQQADATAETGAAGNRRVLEGALLQLSLTAPAAPAGPDADLVLVLGRVTANASRAVTSVDVGEASGRRRSGPAPGAALDVRTLAVGGGRDLALGGDLSVGKDANLLKVGVDVSGNSPGTARLRAEGAVPALVLGAAGTDVVNVSSSRVAIAANVGIRTPPGAQALAVDGNVTVTNGRVSDGRYRAEVKKSDLITIINTGTDTSWKAVTDMTLDVSAFQDAWFAIRFYMGGVEAQLGTNTSVEAGFRLLVDGVEEATTGETFHTLSWSAHGVALERVMKLAKGTHTVKAEWRLLQPPPTRIVGSHLGSMRTLSIVEL